jgi:CheY-like chemotaxis protein
MNFMKSILVIDDDEGIRLLLTNYLSAVGHQIVAMKDGIEGIEAFNNGHNFDLVITDIFMPGLNGNEVAEHIRRSNKGHIPVIAITGSGKDYVQRDLFDHVLMKPFKLKTLGDTTANFFLMNEEKPVEPSAGVEITTAG